MKEEHGYILANLIFHFRPSVIYGQEVLYAARGQDARSRPAKAGIQEGGAGMINGFQSLPARAVENKVRYLVFIPLTLE